LIILNIKNNLTNKTEELFLDGNNNCVSLYKLLCKTIFSLNTTAISQIILKIRIITNTENWTEWIEINTGAKILKRVVIMSLWITQLILTVLLGIGGVAFLTLLERKILGLTQTRLGPNKVTFVGVLQPLADGIKLLLKIIIQPFSKQWVLFLGIPMLFLRVFILIWLCIPLWTGTLILIKFTRLLLFSLFGIRAYAVILTGWSSTSRFSKLGSLRGILQRLSYEVTLVLVLIFTILLIKNLSFYGTTISIEIVIAWLFLWILVSLIERNRAPFDLIEGESELIRGFNIEIPRLVFVYLFLREYGMVIILCLIAEIIAVNSISTITLGLVSLFLFLRRCFPRIRYDSLIRVIWQRILPVGSILRFSCFFFI